MSVFQLKYLPFYVAIVIMGISCAVQGKWSERWGTFPELEIFAQGLNDIPKQVGEWQGVDAQGSDERTRKLAGAEGELVRIYRNASGQELRVSIICARFRDIFYHTPERCYPAAGFEMQGEPQPVVFDIGDTTAEFLSTSFMKSEPTGSHTERGYWSWSANGPWLAPKDPKLTFAGHRVLYKLYVFGNVANGAPRGSDDYCNDFIRAFIPALQQSLRPAFEKAGKVKSAEVASVAAG